ncbi:hypothetical protein DT23_18840 [Thioclava indica]|uniref:Uncharacterized protein n=2 Tax=Thioclava indica TaxID=1353528 RepID=A0A074J8L8_9RHOB|nr:hypothetical protein DT23_18840 [Thioclava indica]
MAAAMMLAAAGVLTPAHALGLDAARKKTLAEYRLTDPGFQSFEAVIKGTTATGVPGLRDGDFKSKTSSIDGMASLLYALPHMPFYKEHRAEIMAQMGTASQSPTDSGDGKGKLPQTERHGLNDRKMGTCVKVGMVMSPIAAEVLAGTIADGSSQGTAAAATPEYFASLHKQAASVLQVAKTVTDTPPRRDMQITAAELELMASRHSTMFTPRLTQALKDYRNWMKTQCTYAAVHQ